MTRFLKIAGAGCFSVVALVVGLLYAWPSIVDPRSPEDSASKRVLGTFSRSLFGEHFRDADEIRNRSAAVQYARRALMSERRKWLLMLDGDRAVGSIFNSVSFRDGGPADRPLGTGWHVGGGMQDRDGWNVSYVMTDDDAPATAFLFVEFSACGRMTRLGGKIFGKS